MKTFAYRASSRQTGLWVALVLLGVAGEVAMVPVMNGWQGSRPVDVWAVLVGIAPLFAMLLLGTVITLRRTCRRKIELEALLKRLGYQTSFDPAMAEKAAHLAPVEHLSGPLDLRQTPGGLSWMAVREEPDGTAMVFEYRFVTGSGKLAQLHTRTVAAWPAGLTALAGTSPGRLPGFAATRFPWLERRAVRKQELNDPAFAGIAETWSLFGNAGTGKQFLTTAVREELSRSPAGESWCLGGGWVCAVFRGPLDAKNLAIFHDRGRRILETAGGSVISNQ